MQESPVNDEASTDVNVRTDGLLKQVLTWAAGIQTVRFAAVGLVNTGVDFATFFALWWLYPPGHDLWLAGAYSVAGWMAGSIASYFLHSHVTFKSRLPATGFYGVALLGVGIQTASTSVAAKAFGSDGAALGKILGIMLGSSVTYMGYRWLAQRRSQRSRAVPE